MASAGMLKRVSDRTGRLSWEVWWRLDDGSRGSKTVRSKAEARNLLTAKRLAIMRGTLEATSGGSCRSAIGRTNGGHCGPPNRSAAQPRSRPPRVNSATTCARSSSAIRCAL